MENVSDMISDIVSVPMSTLIPKHLTHSRVLSENVWLQEGQSILWGLGEHFKSYHLVRAE